MKVMRTTVATVVAATLSMSAFSVFPVRRMRLAAS